MESPSDQLRRFLGTWGCQTRMLDADNLVRISVKAFEVPGGAISEVAAAVSAMSTNERAARVKAAVARHWPGPTALWPAHAPVRKRIEEDGRQGSLFG